MKDEPVNNPPPLADVFAALVCDLMLAKGLVEDLEYENYLDLEEGRSSVAKICEVLKHMQSQACRIHEDLRAFGHMRSTWQASKITSATRRRGGTQSAPRKKRQFPESVVAVSSFCRNSKGGSVEFSRVHVQVPHPSVEGLKVHLCKRQKLEHPSQVRVMKELGGTKVAGQRGVAELKDDVQLSEPKVVQVIAKTGAPQLQLHYPFCFSVTPATVKLLDLEVVSWRAWKDTPPRGYGYLSEDAAEECARSHMAAMLKEVAQSYFKKGVDQKRKLMLGFNWARRAEPYDNCCLSSDGLLLKEYGFFWPALQVKDHSRRGKMLFEIEGDELAVATLAGGGDLRSLQEAAKKQTIKVTVSEAFTGTHVLDLAVMSNDTVRDIGTIVKKQLRETAELAFINGAGTVLREVVKSKEINSYKAPNRPVAGDAVHRRVLKLEVQETAAAGRALAKTKAKAKAKGKIPAQIFPLAHAGSASAQRAAQVSEPCGVVFIDNRPDHAIVLTKTPAEAQQLVELLVQPRPEFFRNKGGSPMMEVYRMNTLAEMLGLWSRDQHLVRATGR